MNTNNKEPSENPDAFHLNAHESEGQAFNCENIHNHYGRQN